MCRTLSRKASLKEALRGSTLELGLPSSVIVRIWSAGQMCRETDGNCHLAFSLPTVYLAYWSQAGNGRDSPSLWHPAALALILHRDWDLVFQWEPEEKPPGMTGKKQHSPSCCLPLDGSSSASLVLASR